ncbi:MAG: hypothetical protein ACE5FM_02580 [Methyloligellaceae bacterium]
MTNSEDRMITRVDDLTDLTKAQIIAIGVKHGLNLNTRWLKAELIEAVIEAEFPENSEGIAVSNETPSDSVDDESGDESAVGARPPDGPDDLDTDYAAHPASQPEYSCKVGNQVYILNGVVPLQPDGEITDLATLQKAWNSGATFTTAGGRQTSESEIQRVFPGMARIACRYGEGNAKLATLRIA